MSAAGNGVVDVAVIGAGPVGLDAALAALERGWSVRIYEAGERPGSAVREWGHVRLFSPWSMNVSPRMRSALGAGVPGDDDRTCPTGEELAARLLDPLARFDGVRDALSTGTRVAAVAREGLLKSDAIGSPRRAEPPFRILLRTAGGERVEHARAVLDCSGNWRHPNATGTGGIPAPGEGALEDRIVRHLPDVLGEPEGWSGRRILLVGGGHSAWTAADDLAELARRAGGRGAAGGEDLEVVWAARDPGFLDTSDPAHDPLPARAALARRASELAAGASPALRFLPGREVVEMRERSDGRVAVWLRGADGADEVVVDRILSLTGFVGDHTIYRQLQVHECYATSGPMKLAASLLGSESEDCLDQPAPEGDVLANPEPDFFILGSKSYGRNSAFLLRTGWSQVDAAYRLLDSR